MSQDYVLFQKCPACGTRKESTLSAIKAQRMFECECCGLSLSLRPLQEPEKQDQKARSDEALTV